MKRACERGSVLMELMVVFPIYLVLFGGLFMIGDMLIRTVRLPSAERAAAFDLGRSDNSIQGWTAVLNELFRPGREITDKKEDTDRLVRENQSAFYADTGIAGPFSVRAAMKVRDDYAMAAGGSRGQLAFADWFFNRSLPDSPRATGPYGTLIAGGRVPMHSKDVSTVRRYFYYTLKRHRYEDAEQTWRDNRRPSSDLLVSVGGRTQRWKEVRDENFHDQINDEASNRMTPPSSATCSSLYRRYSTFVRWSE